MAVLIIGAGLVGSQIARLLVEQGETPVLMDRAVQPKALAEFVDLEKVKLERGDVLRPISLIEVMRRHQITEVIHLVANPMLTMGAQRDPYAAIELNIMGTTNVLEAARVYGVKRVVVASSSVLNHNIAGGEGKGDPMHEEAFPRPASFYATCKQAVENIGLNYARWCGVDFAAMRYGAVAGPWGGDGGGGSSKVFLDMVRAALAEEEALVPASRIEWVYSIDAARATLLAARAGTLRSRVFNVTMGGATSPEELAAALTAAIPGARYRIEVPADRQVMPTQAGTLNTSLARDELGFVPEYPMGAAVRDTVAWFRRRQA